MSQWRWKYTPGCRCGDCMEFEREQAPAFKLKRLQHEREEFERTFRALGGYSFERQQPPFFDAANALRDYMHNNTAEAWRGWLAAADVEWMDTPSIHGNYIEDATGHKISW